jgi:hypothetical protein
MLYSGGSDVYLVSLDTSKRGGDWIRYATYFGGLGYEVLYGFAMLPGGRVALTGYNMFGDLPTAGGAYQPAPGSDAADAFVTILNPALAGTDAIEYSTYFGGELTDVGMAVAVDAAGGIVVTGYTDSNNLPRTDGSQRVNPGGIPSGFVFRFNHNVS